MPNITATTTDGPQASRVHHRQDQLCYQLLSELPGHVHTVCCRLHQVDDTGYVAHVVAGQQSPHHHGHQPCGERQGEVTGQQA